MSFLSRASKRFAPAPEAPGAGTVRPPENKTDGSKRALIAAGVGCGLFLLLIGIKLALSPTHHSRRDDQQAQKAPTVKTDNGEADFSDSLSSYRQQQEAARRLAQEQAAKAGNQAAQPQGDGSNVSAEEATFIRQAWRGAIAIRDARPDALRPVTPPAPAAPAPATVDPQLQRQLDALDKRLAQGGVRP